MPYVFVGLNERPGRIREGVFAVILVTGATGFIGEQLVRELHQRGEPVRILVRSRQKAQAVFGPLLEGMEVAMGDLGDPESLAAAVRGIRRVYHLASRISFKADYAKMVRINVEGTKRLLDACLAAGVERVVHMSSVAAGGPAVAGPDGRLRPRTEADPPQPLPDPYGRTKLAQEQAALGYNDRGMAVVAVRPSAVFGPGDPDGINLLVKLVAKGRLPFYLGSRKTWVSVVYIGDVVKGSIAAMERGRPGEVYQLVGPSLTQEELLALLAEVSGGRAPRWEMPVGVLSGLAGAVAVLSRPFGRTPVHPNDVRNWTASWYLSAEKARRDLGWTPTDMREAWMETFHWIREDSGRS